MSDCESVLVIWAKVGTAEMLKVQRRLGIDTQLSKSF